MKMIEGDRLFLRRPELSDFAPMSEMFSEPGVYGYLWGAPLDASECQAKFQRDVNHWAAHSFGLFSIIDKATGEYIGKTGHACFNRGLEVIAGTSVEIAWTLRTRFHGKGLAREATHLAMDWFEGKRPITTACIIPPDNLASRRLASALGYVETKACDINGKHYALYMRNPICSA